MKRSYIEDSTSTEEPAYLAPLAPRANKRVTKNPNFSRNFNHSRAKRARTYFSSNVALYSVFQCPENVHEEKTKAQKETKPAKIYKLHTIYHR